MQSTRTADRNVDDEHNVAVCLPCVIKLYADECKLLDTNDLSNAPSGGPRTMGDQDGVRCWGMSVNFETVAINSYWLCSIVCLSKGSFGGLRGDSCIRYFKNVVVVENPSTNVVVGFYWALTIGSTKVLCNTIGAALGVAGILQKTTCW